jgi:N6-adenosine-specific RNA methylase IME4
LRLLLLWSAPMFTELTPPYATIVADPPWGYEEMTAPWRSTSTADYSLMSLAKIKALPVQDLAAADAHLYLWAVLPLMRDAFEVVDAWGFTPDTVLTWCKPGVGLGGGYRGNTEHLIVARRGFAYINPTCDVCKGRSRGARKCGCESPQWRHFGKPVCEPPRRPFNATAEGTWYTAPRGEHSEKPALFGDLVERMSPGPYLELFARAPRLGWDSWGYGYESAPAAAVVEQP